MPGEQIAVIFFGLVLVVGLGWFALRRANLLTEINVPTLMRLARTQTGMLSLLVVVLGVLFYGVFKVGLINSLPNESGHIERNRQTSRMIITQDKDGCVDMRTLGRSNGVYLAVAPCKPTEKKDNSDQ